MSYRFAQLATIAARWFGSPWSFVGHLALVVALVCLWPVLGLDSMLLVLTTVLTVDTQLLAVLILNTQNRDARATHMKTDALIFAEPEATNELIGVERLSDRELDALAERLAAVRREREKNPAT